jgi:ferric-dicitrate binding protein FerR (iron transport regulator)
MAEFQGSFSYRLAQVERTVERLEQRLEEHVEEVRTKFEQRAKERTEESREASASRKSDRRWQIGTALFSAGLVVSAIALLLNSLGGSP